MFKTLSQSLLGLVFPSTCDSCGALLAPQQVGVCKPCRSRIKLIQAPHCPTCGRTHLFSPQSCEACRGEVFHFDRAYACTLYEGATKKLLQAYKFHGHRSLRHFFVTLMTDFSNLNIDLKTIDAVISVPMNPQKQRDRGFNQASLLGASLARQIQKPFLGSALICHQNLIPQSSLGKADRKRHVKGVFQVRKNLLVHKKNILLIDDIMTTGHTASECAMALKTGGSGTVTVLTVARGI